MLRDIADHPHQGALRAVTPAHVSIVAKLPEMLVACWQMLAKVAMCLSSRCQLGRSVVHKYAAGCFTITNYIVLII
jgi:hypothetical protein